MTTTSPVGVDNLSINSKIPEKNDSLGQADFLKILTTQLQSQDPLAPMENGEFLGQMAQFSTVSGIEQLNTSISSLSSSLLSGQALQASSVLGREVSLVSDRGALNAGENLDGEFILPSSANSVNVDIFDENGTLVRRIEFGGLEAGKHKFAWDGLDADGKARAPGTYAIKVEANFDGKTQALAPLVHAKVDGVSLGQNGEGATVSLRGLGSLPFSGIYEIF